MKVEACLGWLEGGGGRGGSRHRRVGTASRRCLCLHVVLAGEGSPLGRPGPSWSMPALGREGRRHGSSSPRACGRSNRGCCRLGWRGSMQGDTDTRSSGFDHLSDGAPAAADAMNALRKSRARVYLLRRCPRRRTHVPHAPYVRASGASPATCDERTDPSRAMRGALRPWSKHPSRVSRASLSGVATHSSHEPGPHQEPRSMRSSVSREALHHGSYVVACTSVHHVRKVHALHVLRPRCRASRRAVCRHGTMRDVPDAPGPMLC
jgi:hypothetical protein